MARSSLNMAILVSAVLAAALVQSSAAKTTHVVGASMGWTIPTSETYAAWAGNQTFTVGDSLVFNFATGTHNVAQVTKADYDACTTSTPILVVNTGPATIELNSSGEHYFICNYTGHCNAGQKLAINVIAAATTSPSPSPSPQTSSSPSPAPQVSTSPAAAPASSPMASPPSSGSAPAPSPSGSQPIIYIVGDAMGWTVPAAVGANASAYQIWAAKKSFKVGDKLVFNYVAGKHSVAEVTKASYNSCDTNSTMSLFATPPTTITLNSSGEHFFICTYAGHCTNGQKLAINVTGETSSPTSSPAGSPTSTTSPSSGTTPSSSSGSSSPPPTGNSASSLGVFGVSVAFLSIFVAFLLN